MSTKFLEIEFKYSAQKVALSRFNEVCRTLLPRSTKVSSGSDFFFNNPANPKAFCRHRFGGDINQLTFKKKLSGTNYVRTEHNLDLKDADTADVEALCAEFGYKPSGTLHKTCVQHNYEDHTLVYYICFNDEMKEVGRFIEIEMKEDYPWESDSRAMEKLRFLERQLSSYKGLGIDESKRVMESLPEMFGFLA
jgi:adenylate cyclase class IV